MMLECERTYKPTVQHSAEGAKRIQALERENVELKLLLTQQKNLTAHLQTEVFSRQQALLHLQDMKELQQKYKQTRGLQKSGDTRTDRLVETECKTTGLLSGQDQEDKLKAWESERNMLLKTIENLNLTVAYLNKSPVGNRTEGATRHKKQAGIQTPNSSDKKVENKVKKVKRVRFAEHVVKDMTAEDGVRAGPTPECAQVCCRGSDVQKRNKSSRWSRFINSFACASRFIKTNS
ncbi:hypothetical protein Q5P01_003508 [Channa striata]|uniref:Uncharacterized protein n=1 Tax=Channa striata TaxID=64152 RepID=A0AA88NG23_CHASR|nr:hypothetical protein Q5P01_003508 [Channa striata]